MCMCLVTRSDTISTKRTHKPPPSTQPPPTHTHIPPKHIKSLTHLFIL